MKKIAVWIGLAAALALDAQAQSLDVERVDRDTLRANEAQRSGSSKARPDKDAPRLSTDSKSPLIRTDPPRLDPDPSVPSFGGAHPSTAPFVLPAAPPFAGTPRQGLVEIRRLAGEGRGAEAAALAGVLAERVAEDERMQAELCYAGGVASSIAELPYLAAEDFRSAGALAGPGELRLHALYNEAVQRIVEGEELRAAITEVEAAGDDALSIGQAKVLGDDQDTLPAAREKYLEAKARLLDGIRLDWRDTDLRGNLEFVERRLDELAKIEENRQQSNLERESDGQENEQKTEEGKGATKGQEESETEQEEDGQQGTDPDSREESLQDADPTPGEGADEGDDMPNPKAEEREGEEQQKQEQAETGQENEELQSDAGGAQPDELMSAQEARLILDKLNEIDEQAKRLRAALYRTRMIEVARDW